MFCAEHHVQASFLKTTVCMPGSSAFISPVNVMYDNHLNVPCKFTIVI